MSSGRSAVRRRSEQTLTLWGPSWLCNPSRRILAQRWMADCWQRMPRLPWTTIPLTRFVLKWLRRCRIVAARFCCSVSDWRLYLPPGGGSFPRLNSLPTGSTWTLKSAIPNLRQVLAMRRDVLLVPDEFVANGLFGVGGLKTELRHGFSLYGQKTQPRSDGRWSHKDF